MKSTYFSAFLFVTIFGLFACASHPAQKSETNAEGVKLNAIITDYTERAKHFDAYDATYFNIEKDLDQFGDYASPGFFERGRAIPRDALNQVKTIHPEALTPKDLRTYLIFKENMETQVAGEIFPEEYFQFTQMGNRLHDYLDQSSQELTSFPFDTVPHYEAFVKRSQGFPAYVDNQINLMKEGVQKHLVLSCVTAKAALNTYRDGLVPTIEKNPFYRPVTFMPKNFSEDDRKRLVFEFRQMIKDRILPGYQKFDRFYRAEYLPHCRSQFGMGKLPNGKAWYAHAILSSTSLPLTAEDVHARGLAEVTRITAEMEKVKTELGFKGSLHAFQKSLLKNPKYFFTSSDDLFKAFADVKAKVAAKIPTYFSLIPKHDFKIVASSNPEDASGSYNEPTDMIPYGRFVVNTINLRAVPVYDVTTLLMHETVPGHHFQLALQFEMKDQLSEYQRKLFSCNAFVEGWALYSEHLGYEMGMYTDPIQKLGNLNDEMLRAVRLVVDTGIHAYGWSRAKAIAYMTDHLASDAKDISNEVNRYSVWPGQALGYKIGQMKILELRKYAEDTLGPKFDVKEFHRVVIGSGTVSLTILDTQVKKWVESVQHLTKI
jgi:uncharacterized protein (DUF885 family)